MKLSEELEWRGFIKQKTFSDNAWLDTPRTVYFGADPSADSLHIGNLASYMPLRHMLDRGWDVVLLMGGATGMIGDPGGKSQERNLLSLEQLNHNKRAVEAQVKRLFAGKSFKMVDNNDWLSRVGLLEFLRDTGKHFSMTTLVQREFIADRIGEGGSGISYTEFSYTLLQGYDYWHLFKKFGVVLQYGGSDQWGNMLSGVDLIRRREGKEAHVLAGPLIVDKATGKKFGKTEDGAIWLDPQKTGVFKFYQFWLNLDDDSAKEYLGVYTMLPRNDVEEICQKFDGNRAGRLAQKRLAWEVTSLVHGAERADAAKRASDVLFGEGEFSGLNKQEKTLLKQELAVVKAAEDLGAVLVSAGLASSKTEARTFLNSGAITVNGRKLTPETEKPFAKGDNLVKRGKNSFAIVESHK